VASEKDNTLALRVNAQRQAFVVFASLFLLIIRNFIFLFSINGFRPATFSRRLYLNILFRGISHGILLGLLFGFVGLVVNLLVENDQVFIS
jgi:hypothetical protein